MEYFFINTILWSLIKFLFPFQKIDMPHLLCILINSWSKYDVSKCKFIIMLGKNMMKESFLLTYTNILWNFYKFNIICAWWVEKNICIIWKYIISGKIEIEIEIEIIYFQIKSQRVYNQNISIYNTSKYIKVYTIYSLW